MVGPVDIDTEKARIVANLREAQRAVLAKANPIGDSLTAGAFEAGTINEETAYDNFRRDGYSPHDINQYAIALLTT